MIQDPTPFDHRPDPALGAALREALAPGDPPAFVARVVAALDAHSSRSRSTLVHHLASWARAGIAATAAAAIIGGLLLGRRAPAPASLDDVVVLAAGPTAQALLEAPAPPDPSFVLVSAEER